MRDARSAHPSVSVLSFGFQPSGFAYGYAGTNPLGSGIGYEVHQWIPALSETDFGKRPEIAALFGETFLMR
jgi:hypothetical protein